MRGLLISVILALSLVGTSAMSFSTNLQNQNSGKSSSNKNTGKSANKNSTKTKGNKNTASTATGTGNPDAKVWVNTASGVYHCAGSKWYGKTKAGEYMTQKEAPRQELPRGPWKALPVGGRPLRAGCSCSESALS